MGSVTTYYILATRRALKDGTYPVKLRITFNRKYKDYPNGYQLSEEDFRKVQGPKPRGEFKEIQIALQAFEQRALEVINKLPAFSFYEFERRFNDTSVANDVFIAFGKVIETLDAEGRAGTASSYSNARNSLLSFVKKQIPSSNKGLTIEQIKAKSEQQKKTPPLPFQAVTVGFLKEYEKWMVVHGRSKTTIGIYLRPLRALFNEAIRLGNINKDTYPFGKGKFKIPAGRNIKKAIDLTQIGKLFSYQPEDKNEAWARDMWLFSYLCNGINVKDIARLKYKQISNDSITFIRAKTENTTRENLKPIVAALSEEAKDIIKRWGTKPIIQNGYVFSIYKENMPPEKQLAASREAIKQINKYIRRISQKVGIDKDVTTYVARHSFSTVLTLAGMHTKNISELLGHANEKTTSNYQASLEAVARKEVTNHLTAFKKKD